MEQDDLLRVITRVLEELKLPYLVTGSIATIYYGEPRFTADIHIVADLPEDQVQALCAALPSEEFYLSEESARRAVHHGTQFNILHPTSGLKVDLMVSDRSPFDRSRFERSRRLASGDGLEVNFAAPEDVILKKMEYYRAGKSDKHLRDIAGVLKISGPELDFAYLETWAQRLGVAEIWEQIRAQVVSAADG